MTASEQLKRAREVFDVEIEGLKAVRDSLDESFVEAVGLFSRVVENGGIVVVTGVGKSLHVAEKMSGIFSSTGTRSVVLNPVQAMHGDLGMVSSRDVLLALSFSGESEEIVRLIPAIRRHSLKVVSITGNSGSTLATLSDIHLSIPCGKEACPFGLAPAAIARAYQAKDAAQLEALSVNACMECGCCSYICPANRPLVQTNRLSKAFLKDIKAKEDK